MTDPTEIMLSTIRAVEQRDADALAARDPVRNGDGQDV